MALAEIKARIAVVLEQVHGIGAVYTRMRPVNVESMEQSQFVVNGTLNCCFITRGSAELATCGEESPVANEWDTISIHQFYAVSDANASEDAFDALVTAMLWAIFNDGKWPNFFNKTAKWSRPPKLKAMDFRHFGTRQALCHHAEITLQVMTQ